ncbi:MAG TPA: glycoside hydrolase family 15 protein [Beijerinckiaceae bacterium]|nr:glycoside hydrolase family 15 protein [Beijerinckiaceae bacterium]
MSELGEWIETERRYAVGAMLASVSATHLVKERPGFGQTIVPRPGSIVASPVPASYDPDPDYFFHWFRDSAIVIDALRVAWREGLIDKSALLRLREFVTFSLSLRTLNGEKFLRQADFRSKVQPFFLQYVRPDDQIAAVSGENVLADTRVNPDGTLDISRWNRPQADGPAMRCIALLRWLRQRLDLEPTLRSAIHALLDGDLAFTLARVKQPSFDIWEEQNGFHYHTQIVQAEALDQGAAWLDENGEAARADACRTAANDIQGRLERLWNGRVYASRASSTTSSTDRELDVAVILGTLHAGRPSGPHSVLDPRAQATLTALEELFESEYAINQDRPRDHAPALGRYTRDAYYSGGAYYFATLAAAEFYYALATALFEGAGIAVTEDNALFIRRLATGSEERDNRTLAAHALRRGDAFMRTVRAYTPSDGELSEQFDQKTGAQTSAKHLAWSYAAFITAASARTQAIVASSAANQPGSRASTA